MKPSLLDRRLVLGSLAGLGGCTGQLSRTSTNFAGPSSPIAPLSINIDRLFDITVCLRPFRARGPRINVEQVGDALVVHNYGHGGSGWSLSWGAATLAVQKAMASSPRDIAVVGCGALGLTSAIMAQRAGAQVTIYAKEHVHQTRSARATGTWSPDSRIALARDVDPQFGALWEKMARISWKTYHSYLGLAGAPVEFSDRYMLRDQAAPPVAGETTGTMTFASYNDRIADLVPAYLPLPTGSTPFPVEYVERSSALTFNIASYSHTLLTDFYSAGGRFELREFHEPGEIARLQQKVVINCAGYGARALWKDESIVPVRGQVGWLIPQSEARYGVRYRGVQMLSRRDGIAIQAVDGGDLRGYNQDSEAVDRAETERAIGVISDLYSRFGHS